VGEEMGEVVEVGTEVEVMGEEVMEGVLKA
jgi:hypothetical protein